MSPAASSGWRDVAVCLSLANLCYLDVWHRLQSREAADLDYFRKVPLSEALLVTTGNVLLLGLALWMGMRLVRRSRNRSLLKAAQCVFFLVLTIPLGFAPTLPTNALAIGGGAVWVAVSDIRAQPVQPPAIAATPTS